MKFAGSGIAKVNQVLTRAIFSPAFHRLQLQLQFWLVYWTICLRIGCRTPGEFLSQLTALTLGAELSKIQDGAYSTDVILMTFPNWLRCARVAQYVLRCSTIRHRPKPRSCRGLNSPHTSRQVKMFCRPLVCGSLKDCLWVHKTEEQQYIVVYKLTRG